MWCTVSAWRERSQHLPSCSHQHDAVAFASVVSRSPAATLRHLITCSCLKTGRTLVLMIAFIVPGLYTWSEAIADVSVVPGRVYENICTSSVVPGMPEVRISDTRVY